MKDVIVSLLVGILLFAMGICLGRVIAIHQAELLEINEDVYYIRFGEEIHEYTKEEMQCTVQNAENR